MVAREKPAKPLLPRGIGPAANPAAAAPRDPCAVAAADLDHTGALLELLHELNDQFARPKPIEAIVRRIPVLEARVIADAKRRAKTSDDIPLSRALILIGNAGLESTLFGLLEDLTVLKGELEEG